MEEILSEQLLTLINVEEYVAPLIEKIKSEIDLLIPSIENEITRIESKLTKECFKCEYSIEEKSGYAKVRHQ